MKRILLSLTLVFCFSGCSALKESTGEYITEAIRDKIVSDVDGILEKRGLSLAEFKNLADENGDSTLNPQEVVSTVKSLAKDYFTLEARNVIDSKLAEYQKKMITSGDLDSRANETWLWLIGAIGTMVSGYLTKQVFSAKKDGKRDERIAVLEKMLNKDLDGDGLIGSNGVQVEA